MTDEPDVLSKRAEKYFDVAADVRKFEIGLFWQRSLFFWGFIGAAFVAYAELGRADNGEVLAQLAIACFGFVCSVAWALLNRGSKYWQEAWETKTERKEECVFGERLFAREEEIQPKFWVLRARRYSVSKLLIALSDFTALVWLFLTVRLLPWCLVSVPSSLWLLIMPVFAIGYAIYMGIACRSSRSQDSP